MTVPPQLHLQTPFADAAAKIDSVVELLKTHNIKVSPGSSVGSLFAKVRQLNKQYVKTSGTYDQAKFFAAMEALWIAAALEMAVGDPRARESIRRIIGSEMDLSGRTSSQGKDALFELDFYRRLKLGGAEARFDEPDIVVSLGGGLGDCGIACKKVYLESGIPGALEYGCHQLKEAKLPGVVVFNLDEFTEEKAVLHAPTSTAMLEELKKRVQKLTSPYLRDIQKVIERGACDGVMFSISIICHIDHARPPINLARIPFSYDHRRLPLPDKLASARFSAIQRYVDNPKNR